MPISIPQMVGAVTLAALSLASGYVFYREYDQSLRGIMDDDTAFEHWMAPDHISPLSGQGQLQLLSSCVFALESWKTAFQSSESVQLVAQNCANEADHAISLHPSLSEAHYVKAYLAYLQNDPEAARTALAQAQMGAPKDQWLAVRRVNLAQKLWPGEATVGAYDLQNDLGLLIASFHGLDTATALYIKYPQLRDMIVASTEELDDKSRLRFLNRLKRAVARQ